MRNHRFFLPGRLGEEQIVRKSLGNGFSIPFIGFGTFSARLTPAQMGQAVETALGYGYRMLDCAAMYGNEDVIGSVLKDAQSAGIPREELFILSKLPNTKHGKGVEHQFRKTLTDLKLDYLDAYLVHWPVPNALSPEADKGIYLPESRPYVHEEFMETWQGLEQLVKDGLVRSIGVSNVTLSKLKLLLRDASVAPVINEMEIHPTFQQEELFSYTLSHNILPIAYSPIGAPHRPERNKMPGDLVDTENETIKAIAQAHEITPVAVCLKWAVQRGQVPVPFTSTPVNMLANLQAVTSAPLSEDEMKAIKGVEGNNRLSRGQAYLWPGAVSWHELWDEKA